MIEVHSTPYAAMYTDLCNTVRWKNSFVCVEIYSLLACENKALEAIRLLNMIDIPEWKWEKISMDFVVGFPRSAKGHNAI